MNHLIVYLLSILILTSCSDTAQKKTLPSEKVLKAEYQKCSDYSEQLVADLVEFNQSDYLKFGREFSFPQNPNESEKILRIFSPIKFKSEVLDIARLNARFTNDYEEVGKVPECLVFKENEYKLAVIGFLAESNVSQKLKLDTKRDLLLSMLFRTNSATTLIQNLLNISVLNYGVEKEMFLSQKKKISELYQQVQLQLDEFIKVQGASASEEAMKEHILLSQITTVKLHNILVELLMDLDTR